MTTTQVHEKGKTAPDFTKARQSLIEAAGMRVVFHEIERVHQSKATLSHRLHLWFLALRILKNVEDNELGLYSDQNKDKKISLQHRDMLTGVLAMGETLNVELHENKGFIGDKALKEIFACLEEVRINYRMWYGGMSKRTAEKILGSIGHV